MKMLWKPTLGSKQSPVRSENISSQSWLNESTRTDATVNSDEQDSVGCSDQPDEFFDAVQGEENKYPMTLSSALKFVQMNDLDFIANQSDKISELKMPFLNSYTEPPASLFQVRGKDYLTKSGKNMKDLKVPSDDAPYQLIGLNVFHSKTAMKQVSNDVGDVRRYLSSFPPDAPNKALPQFLLINWIMRPLFSRETWFVSHVYKLRSKAIIDAPLENAFNRFKAGTSEEKNTQFKYIFKIVDAPRVVQSSVKGLGGERPVIIGKNLTTTYYQGPNFLEINMDVSSSRIASAINSIILKNVQNVSCDLTWLLEGQKEDELPERLLAAVRWNWVNVEDITVDLDSNGERIVQ